MNMIEVVAAIIERDGKILLAQRPAHSDQAGLWEFAGGKVEPDEKPAAGAGA
ncbi:CTP pyrophosphohydrolase [Escherichia coli]|uniref:CTP pyrophosphohydrolase n=1 Tax=Escherichia coli TaxID=562 RepID=A0A376VH28_ECOLX|nr:CTP pyrophosphohydrolase [Escherichia coli]